MEITRGKIPKAIKTVIYGPEGIGKSTLASKFPEPVFIDTEGSTSHMDVARFPAPASWTMLLQELDEVKRDPAVCKTLVIDTADWAERLCISHVLSVNKWDSIESPGYGRGYVYVREEFGRFLNKLTDIVNVGVNVVVTAHAQMRKFEQPDELGAYDRWELKLSKHDSPLVKEWADVILFCNYKTMVVNVDGQGTQKGKNKAQGGRRVMYAQHHPCWDAKNRFGLPYEMDMDYEQIRPIFENDARYTQKDAENHEKTRKTEPKKKTLTPVADNTPSTNTPAPPVKTEAAPEPEAESLVSIYLSNPDHLPRELKQLMETDQITEWEIQQVVMARGYFPPDTPIEKMEQASPGFVKGWIVKFWPNVKSMALDIRKREQVPFN